MTSGFLKTAIGASLAVHAAGLAVVVCIQLPQRPAASLPADTPFVMTITAIPDETVDADTVSLSPPPAQPVEPVVVPKPEIAPTPPPEPERIPDPPKPVVLQPELPIMPMPNLLAIVASATPAPEPVKISVAGPPVASEAKEVSNARAIPAPRGERVITRAQPNYRKNSERIYPVAAIKRREEGLVIVSAEVDTRGFPQKVELKQTSGHPLLDDAALRAVSLWEFEPARIDGRAIVSTVEVPVNFKLTN